MVATGLDNFDGTFQVVVCTSSQAADSQFIESVCNSPDVQNIIVCGPPCHNDMQSTCPRVTLQVEVDVYNVKTRDEEFQSLADRASQCKGINKKAMLIHSEQCFVTAPLIVAAILRQFGVKESETFQALGQHRCIFTGLFTDFGDSDAPHFSPGKAQEIRIAKEWLQGIPARYTCGTPRVGCSNLAYPADEERVKDWLGRPRPELQTPSQQLEDTPLTPPTPQKIYPTSFVLIGGAEWPNHTCFYLPCGGIPCPAGLPIAVAHGAKEISIAENLPDGVLLVAEKAPGSSELDELAWKVV